MNYPFFILVCWLVIWWTVSIDDALNAERKFIIRLIASFPLIFYGLLTMWEALNV